MITLTTPDLLSALEFIAPFTDKQSTIPICRTVRLEPADDVLWLTATDLECVGRQAIPIQGGDGMDGAVCVPARLLLYYVRTIPAEHPVVRLKFTTNALTVSHGEYATVTLDGMSAVAFPQIPKVPDIATAVSFVPQLTRARISISDEESRFTLSGALLEIDGTEGKIVSTDGHRLGIQPFMVDPAVKLEVRMPKRGMNHLIRAGDAAYGMASDDMYLFFSTGDGRREIIMRQLTGKFPGYERVVKDWPNMAKFKPAELLAALNGVGQMADSRSRCIHFTLKPNGLELAAKTQENGSASDMIPVDYAGPEIAFSVNGQYVKQFLELADDEATMKVDNETSVIRFEAAGWLYLCMPMRS